MLKEYRWSSFPGICGFEESSPWLEGSTGVGWHHWDIRKKRDRMAFWRYLEARALEKEDGEELNEMRSGWYLGGRNSETSWSHAWAMPSKARSEAVILVQKGFADMMRRKLSG